MRERNFDYFTEHHLKSQRAEVHPSRRLLRSNTDSSVSEFLDTVVENHIISILRNSEQASIYEEMFLKRLPVFSSVYEKDEIFLTTPNGTSILGRKLEFIARDLRNYSGIFFQLGKTLHALKDANLGLPEPSDTRTVLDNFAFFSNIDGANYTVGTTILPPFKLNPEVSLKQEVGFISEELIVSERFSETQMAGLLSLVEMGWVGDNE